MRASQEIKAEIEAKFGFFPPFFAPALESPQVLENLWQQTLAAYVNNPLSALFKEKLNAYLSRYCEVPYCMVCHSCVLRPLGMTAQEVLTLLESPPPTEAEISQHLSLLEAQSDLLATLPEPSSALEKSLLYCAIYIFLEGDQAQHYRRELRRLLGAVNYNHLVAYVAYIKTCHTWMEAHPEVSYEADQRALDHLDPLLAQEPYLMDFFRSYRQRVKRERQSRAEHLATLAERQRHEEILRRREQEFEALLANTPDVMIRCDRKLRYIYVSPAVERTTSLPIAAFIGKTSEELGLPLELCQLWDATLNQVFATGQEQAIEFQSPTVDGLRNYQSRVVPEFDKQGEVQYALVVSRDITQLKQAEAELQRQILGAQLFAEITLKIRQSLDLEEVLQTTVTEVQKIFQADRVLLFQLGPDGFGKVVNEAVVPGWPSIIEREITDDCFGAEYLQRYRQGRVYTIDALDAAQVHPCLREFLQQFGVKAKLVVPILLQDKLWGLLIAHQCSHSRQWNSFEIALLQQLADQVGIALVQAQLLAEESSQRQELTRSNTELEQFAYVASHDLQEPLRMVTSYLQLLQRRYKDKLDADADEFIAYAVDGASRMQILINDLLTYSRVGTRAKTFEPTDCNTVLQRVLRNLQVAIAEQGAVVNFDPLPVVMAVCHSTDAIVSKSD